MALSFAVQEGEIRAQLHADILAAWAATKIYDDQAELPERAGALPIAFVLLVDTQPNAEEGGMQEEGIDLKYQITGRFSKPGSGTLQAAKLARAEDLRARLCGARRYLGHNREWESDNYLSPDPEARQREATQAFYDVTISFTVTITVPAF